jgi:hypothetical protein
MNAGTQLDRLSSVLSFEEPAGHDPETGEEIPLGDMLAGNADDQAMAASRAVDWEDFLSSHNPRYKVLVGDFAQGKRAKDTAEKFGFSCRWAYDLRDQLADDLREYFGDDAIADSAQVPSWRGSIMVDQEKAACRAERRRC